MDKPYLSRYQKQRRKSDHLPILMMGTKRFLKLEAHHVYLLTLILIYIDENVGKVSNSPLYKDKFGPLDIIYLLTFNKNEKLLNLHDTQANSNSCPQSLENTDSIHPNDGNKCSSCMSCNELVYREILGQGARAGVSLNRFKKFLKSITKVDHIFNMVNFFNEYVLKNDTTEKTLSSIENIKKISYTSVFGSFITMCIESFDQMDFLQYQSLLSDIQKPLQYVALDKFQHYEYELHLEKNVNYTDLMIERYIFTDEDVKTNLISYKLPQFLFDFYNFHDNILKNEKNQNFDNKEQLKDTKIHNYMKLMDTNKKLQDYNNATLISSKFSGIGKNANIISHLNVDDIDFLTNLIDKQYIPSIEHIHLNLDNSKNLNELDNNLCMFAIIHLYFGNLDTAITHFENTLNQARTLKNPELLNMVFMWIFICMCEYPQTIQKFNNINISIEEIITSLKDYKNVDLHWLEKIYSNDVLYKMKSINGNTITQTLATYMAACLVSLQLKAGDALNSQIMDPFPTTIYQTAINLYESIGFVEISDTYAKLKYCNQQQQQHPTSLNKQFPNLNEHTNKPNSDSQQVFSQVTVDGLDELKSIKYKGFLYIENPTIHMTNGVLFHIINTGYKCLVARDYRKMNVIFKYKELDFLPYEFLRNLDMLYLHFLIDLENYDEAIQFCKHKREECENVYNDRIWEFEFLMKQIDIYIVCSGNSIPRYLPMILEAIDLQIHYGDDYRTLHAFMKLINVLDNMEEYELVFQLLNYNVQYFYRYEGTKLFTQLFEKYYSTIVKMCDMFPENDEVMKIFYYIKEM